MIKFLFFSIAVFYVVLGFGQQDIDQNSIGVIKIDSVINGSGFVCKFSNMVFTCAHVIKPNKPLFFQAQGSGEQFPLKLVYVDKNIDLAILLSVNPISKNPIQIETKDCAVGDKISYCGYDSRFNKILWFDSQIDEVQNSNQLNSKLLISILIGFRSNK